MRLALRAEWTKVRTVAGPWWLLLGVIVATVALGAGATSVVGCTATATAADPATVPAAGCGGDPTRLSLVGVQLGQALVAMLAVSVLGGEYRSGLIRTTLVAMPRRGTVLAAKAVVLAGVVAGAGSVAVLGSLLAGRFVLADRAAGQRPDEPRSARLAPERPWSPGEEGTRSAGGGADAGADGFPTDVAWLPTDGPTLRASVGSVLYLVLIALLSLGVAALVRNSATSVGIVLGLLYLLPLLSQVVGDPHGQRLLQRIAPTSAGLAVQATTQLRELPLGPWAGLGVTAGWAAAALLAGGLLFRGRDG